MFISNWIRKLSVKQKVIFKNAIIASLILLAMIMAIFLEASHRKSWERFENNTLKKFELLSELSREIGFKGSVYGLKSSVKAIKMIIREYERLERVTKGEKEALADIEKQLSPIQGNEEIDGKSVVSLLSRLENLAAERFVQSKEEYKAQSLKGYLGLIVLLLGALLGAIIVGLLFSRYLLISIDKLKEGAKAIRAGHLEQPITIDSEDEFGELAREMDYMREALLGNINNLTRSNKELEQFAYVTSHDLQEPLRKVISFGERAVKKISEEEGLDEKTVFYIERMMSAAVRMRSLIDDLLSYSRVSTKGGEFKNVNLNKVLNGVLSDLEVTITEKKAKIVADDLPLVKADPLQMRQLFQNLIGNALKFSRKGVEPVVEIKVKDKFEKAMISISDNGIGFDPKYSERIFAPFQRLHSRQEYAGTGIGLAVCNKIAIRHGGALSVESKEGEGSTFSFEIYKAL